MTDIPVISCLLSSSPFPPIKWDSEPAECPSNKQPCLLTCVVWLTTLMALVEACVQCLLLVSKRYPRLFQGVSCFQEEENPAERSLRIQKCLEFSRFTRSNDCGSCCPICLNEFEDEDMVVSGWRKCCKNRFHDECLSSWLQMQSTCPCCRYEIIRCEKS